MAETRGTVLRLQYDDLKRRIDAADAPARSACFNFISSTFDSVSDAYSRASNADRERMLKEVFEVSRKLWDAGNRPQALALGVITLNIESRFTPGNDAGFVEAQTDTLIKQASG